MRSTPAAGFASAGDTPFVYRIREGRVEIARVLHDAMDFHTHIPEDFVAGAKETFFSFCGCGTGAGQNGSQFSKIFSTLGQLGETDPSPGKSAQVIRHFEPSESSRLAENAGC